MATVPELGVRINVNYSDPFGLWPDWLDGAISRYQAWNAAQEAKHQARLAGIDAGLGWKPGTTAAVSGMAMVGASQEEAAAKWVLGGFKSAQKWANQFSKRGWTSQAVTEAVETGERHAADNLVNKANAATRYVHPTTGRSVVIDDKTRELLHVGGDGFKYE